MVTQRMEIPLTRVRENFPNSEFLGAYLLLFWIPENPDTKELTNFEQSEGSKRAENSNVVKTFLLFRQILEMKEANLIKQIEVEIVSLFILKDLSKIKKFYFSHIKADIRSETSIKGN